MDTRHLNVHILRTEMTATATRKLNLVELYAGTARSAKAFSRWRRCRVALLVDNDDFAATTYRLNHPRAPYLVADVARLSASEIEAHAGGRVDILLACPPCQGFSDTGQRDPRDPRNAHLTRFSRLARELRPLAVAMENVPLAGESRRFQRFVELMESGGYRSTWGVLNSALRGSPQCRHRLVYIGIRDDLRADPLIPPPTHGGAGRYFSYRLQRMARVDEDPMSMLSESPGARRVRDELPYTEASYGPAPIPTVREALDGLPAPGSRMGKRLCHYAWKHTAAMRRRMEAVPEGGRWDGGRDHFSHSYGRLHRKGLAHTITTFFSNPGSGRYWHPVDDRAISIREAARIQGFPDEFAFVPEAMNSCRLVGNALDARLANVTYRVIRRALS